MVKLKVNDIIDSKEERVEMKIKKVICLLLTAFLLYGCKKEEPVLEIDPNDVGNLCMSIKQIDEQSFEGVILFELNQGFLLQDEDQLYKILESSFTYANMKDSVDKTFVEKSIQACKMNDATVLKSFTVEENEKMNLMKEDFVSSKEKVTIQSSDHNYEIELPRSVVSVPLEVIQQPDPQPVKKGIALSMEKELISFTDDQMKRIKKDVLGKGVSHTFMVCKVAKEGKITICPSEKLDEEGYEFSLQYAMSHDIGVSQIPVVTLLKFNKGTIQDDTVVNVLGKKTFSELKPYLYYQNSEFYLIDVNPLIYNYDSLETYLLSENKNLDVSRLDEVMEDLKDQIIHYSEDQ